MQKRSFKSLLNPYILFKYYFLSGKIFWKYCYY